MKYIHLEKFLEERISKYSCKGKFLVLVEQYYRKKIGKKGEKKGKRKGEKERRKKGKRGTCWTVFLE